MSESDNIRQRPIVFHLEYQKLMTNLKDNPLVDPTGIEKKVRFVTAASLFDGHDASINIMRRMLQGLSLIHISEPTRPY